MAPISQMTPGEAEKLVAEGKALLIDVRSIGEAIAEQISGSLFVPFDLVNAERLQAAGLVGKVPVLVCRSDNRANMAAEALAQELDNVAVLKGGLVQWKQDGLPVSQGRRALPIDRQVLVGAGTMILLFTVLGLLVSPIFFGLAIFMSCGMIFAGVTGACGMARVLMLMPWNKAPLCGGTCSSAGS